MAECDYVVRVSVDKELPAVASGTYSIDFCSSTAAGVEAPKLRISVSSFGTTDVEGVLAQCYTVGTSEVILLNSTPFGTNASNAYVMLRESSGSTAANIVVRNVDARDTFRFLPGNVSFCNIAAGFEDFVAVSQTSTTTGKIEVLAIGG